VHVPHTYDYAIVRVVPRVERGEFVNAGIILSCDVERFLEACIALDERALLALDPAVDLDPRAVSLAGCREEHHGANLPGSHRSMFGFELRTRASDGDDGQAAVGSGVLSLAVLRWPAARRWRAPCLWS